MEQIFELKVPKIQPLTKQRVDQLLKQFKKSMYLEETTGCRSKYHVNVMTTAGHKTLGKVTGKIKKWYKLQEIDSHQPNILWYKFP